MKSLGEKMLESKISDLKKEFLEWPAARFHHLSLDELSKGKSKASLLITNMILTPHQMPMVNGLMIATMASMSGVYAVKTLIYDEYPLLIKINDLRLYEPSVLNENKLMIETHVINNREARKDTIIVAATVKSETGKLKVKCIFYYRIVEKDSIEPTLRFLAKSPSL